jgi:hypothetical protein
VANPIDGRVRCQQSPIGFCPRRRPYSAPRTNLKSSALPQLPESPSIDSQGLELAKHGDVGAHDEVLVEVGDRRDGHAVGARPCAEDDEGYDGEEIASRSDASKLEGDCGERGQITWESLTPEIPCWRQGPACRSFPTRTRNCFTTRQECSRPQAATSTQSPDSETAISFLSCSVRYAHSEAANANLSI